jgi:hypothetical protein
LGGFFFKWFDCVFRRFNLSCRFFLMALGYLVW